MDELNRPPQAYRDSKLIAKGFYPSVTEQDFPIYVRKRKWQVEPTREVVNNTWDTTAKLLIRYQLTFQLCKTFIQKSL